MIRHIGRESDAFIKVEAPDQSFELIKLRDFSLAVAVLASSGLSRFTLTQYATQSLAILAR